ncbi:MAG TPA: hypothetical protein VEV17_16470 [Bryobacteraceae bacterium]|nr:hypothetical protein [Bryobacteraceae bacterium]
MSIQLIESEENVSNHNNAAGTGICAAGLVEEVKVWDDDLKLKEKILSQPEFDDMWIHLAEAGRSLSLAIRFC